MLDQQPVRSRVASAVVLDPHQHPTTLEPLTREHELEIAGRERVLRSLRALRRPQPAIPHLHGAAAVLALRNRAFEVAVVERMIFHLDGQAFVRRIHRRPLGHRPRLEDAVQLQAQIPMQMTRGMLLDHEAPMLRGQHLARAARLLGLGEIPLGPVLLELRRCLFHGHFRMHASGHPVSADAIFDFACFIIGK